MDEKSYYEQSDIWASSRYLCDQSEINRFKLSIELIPESVKSLADLGCGNGTLLHLLEQEGRNISLYGFERSVTAIENKVCNCSIFQGSIDKLPFETNSFDICIAQEVLEHLPFKVFENSLSEIERVSSQFILISVPYREHRTLNKCPYCGCSFSPFYHLRVFDENKLQKLFPKFSIEKTALLNPVKKYYHSIIIRKIKNLVLNRKNEHWLNTTECPQCGFKPNEPVVQHTENDLPRYISKINDFCKLFLPYKREYTWISCLYKRNFPSQAI
jgi:SAM-dependent methyltransferase